MKRQEIRVKTLKEKEQEQLQKTTVHTDPSTSHPVKSEMPAEFMPTLMPASPKARPLSHRKYSFIFMCKILTYLGIGIYHQFHRYQAKEDPVSLPCNQPPERMLLTMVLDQGSLYGCSRSEA